MFYNIPMEQSFRLSKLSVSDNQPIRHTVDFKNPFNIDDLITRYISPTKVERNNFTAMLIRSFAISHGLAGRQYVYFEWLQYHSGFDYLDTFSNFYWAGGWNSLHKQEQSMFLHYFHKVGKHAVQKDSPDIKTFIETPYIGLKDQIDMLFEINGVDGMDEFKIFRELAEGVGMISHETALIAYMHDIHV